MEGKEYVRKKLNVYLKAELFLRLLMSGWFLIFVMLLGKKCQKEMVSSGSG